MGKRYSDYERKEIIEKEGYKLLNIIKSKTKGGNSIIKVKIQCPEGHIYTTSFHSFLEGKRCKECYYKSKRIKFEDVEEKCKKNGFKLLKLEKEEKYTYITVECKNGHVSKKIFTSLNTIGGCDKCVRHERIKWSNEKIIEYINNHGYIFLHFVPSNIAGERRMLIKCSNPNHKPYEVYLSNFLNGKRCPYCNESKGEKRIEEILIKYNQTFNIQHKFDDCKFKSKLPFDFYLPNHNCCIEYDGQGHYEIINWRGNKDKSFDNFVECKIRDTIKNIYCKKNNIKLIRIPYWDFDKIENIIVNKLKLD